MTTLVTGANGFVGRALCRRLADSGAAVRAGSRVAHAADSGVDSVVTGDLSGQTDWTSVLEGIDTVVHLAARVHVMREHSRDPLALFRQVNVVGTRQLAQQAVEAGVRRFVYVSSIKVNGEGTHEGPFSEADQPDPQDAYALSKWETEQVLRQLEAEAGIEVVVVRPPLVYGPGVKGNFFSLLRAVRIGVPLPFGRCQNRRSLVGLDNLVDLLVQCTVQPAAAGETFLVSDGEDLSTPELLRRIAAALGRPARLLPIPPGWLRSAARLLGQDRMYDRLCESLQIDIGKARQVLGWSPVQSVDAELARTASWYLGARANGKRDEDRT